MTFPPFYLFPLYLLFTGLAHANALVLNDIRRRRGRKRGIANAPIHFRHRKRKRQDKIRVPARLFSPYRNIVRSKNQAARNARANALTDIFRRSAIGRSPRPSSRSLRARATSWWLSAHAMVTGGASTVTQNLSRKYWGSSRRRLDLWPDRSWMTCCGMGLETYPAVVCIIPRIAPVGVPSARCSIRPPPMGRRAQRDGRR